MRTGSDSLQQLLSYSLPPEQIALYPAKPRESARLLCVNRGTQSLQDSSVGEIQKILSKNDLLVFNNSKVIPARLICSQNRTELLLLEETSPAGGPPWAHPPNASLPERTFSQTPSKDLHPLPPCSGSIKPSPGASW